MAEKKLELPVTEVESEATSGDKVLLRVRLKGQRPEDECLLKFIVKDDLIKAIHDAKKRGGTIWVRFNIVDVPELSLEKTANLIEPRLVVRDVLE